MAVEALRVIRRVRSDDILALPSPPLALLSSTNTTQQIVTEYATMNRLKGGMGTFPSPFSDVVAALETISSLDVFNIVHADCVAATDYSHRYRSFVVDLPRSATATFLAFALNRSIPTPPPLPFSHTHARPTRMFLPAG